MIVVCKFLGVSNTGDNTFPHDSFEQFFFVGEIEINRAFAALRDIHVGGGNIRLLDGEIMVQRLDIVGERG